MHLLEAMRAAVLVLLASAVALGVVTLTRWSSPPATVVVVPIATPALGYGAPSPYLEPGVCDGYDWRRSSVDLRWYCGYRD